MRFEKGFWADLLRPFVNYIERPNYGFQVR
jgi:hypothetical protein